MGRASQRIDYDLVAHSYDSQPFRQKTPDPELGAVIERSAGAAVRALDVGCGTGNQQVANLAAYPDARLFGADLFLGMLRQAAAKTRAVSWTQCDGAKLPFRSRSFDYVSNQFSLHHVRDKRGLIEEVFRVLAPAGRFVLSNLCPEGMEGRALYRYFPETRALDARDHLSVAEHLRLMREAGFEQVEEKVTPRAFTRSVEDFRAFVGRRDVISELVAISDEAYARGLERVDAELARGTREISDQWAVMQIAANKPRG